MFYASDDEAASSSRPVEATGGAEHLPPKLKFLQSVCECKKRVCYQQFITQSSSVQRKRDEFRALQPHEKDVLLLSGFNIKGSVHRLLQLDIT